MTYYYPCPEIRCNEQENISKISYLTTFGISLAPTVPIISAVVTFMAHIGSGNTLTAAQVRLFNLI